MEEADSDKLVIILCSSIPAGVVLLCICTFAYLKIKGAILRRKHKKRQAKRSAENGAEGNRGGSGSDNRAVSNGRSAKARTRWEDPDRYEHLNKAEGYTALQVSPDGRQRRQTDGYLKPRSDGYPEPAKRQTDDRRQTPGDGPTAPRQHGGDRPSARPHQPGNPRERPAPHQPNPRRQHQPADRPAPPLPTPDTEYAEAYEFHPRNKNNQQLRGK